jgi:ClpP class serine protease
MNLIDVLTSPWAIEPDKLREIQAIYATHLRGEKIDVAAIEARMGRPLANDQKRYEVQSGGVGLLTVRGVMAPRANLFMQVSGGVSSEMLRQQLDSMAADSRVKSALIAADSPGGNVLGIPAAIDSLRALAAAKPTVLVGEGTIASAMYWLGSAANAVFIQGATDRVGSLGVYARFGWDPKDENTVEIVRGSYKMAGVNGQGPSKEWLAYAGRQLDHLYTVLVDDVAQHRGVSSKQVLEHMADGRVFIGQQAIDAGLVDGVSTVEAMVDRLATDPLEFAQRRKAVFALGAVDNPPTPEDEPVLPVASADDHTPLQGATMPPVEMSAITLAMLERDRPDLFAQLRDTFLAQGRTEGAQAEVARVAGVRAAALPGHEKLIDGLAADGKTTPAEASLQVIAAERQARAKAAGEHAEDAPPAAKPAAAPEGGTPDKAAQAAEAQRYATEHGVDIVAALKALGYAA